MFTYNMDKTDLVNIVNVCKKLSLSEINNVIYYANNSYTDEYIMNLFTISNQELNTLKLFNDTHKNDIEQIYNDYHNLDGGRRRRRRHRRRRSRRPSNKSRGRSRNSNNLRRSRSYSNINSSRSRDRSRSRSGSRSGSRDRSRSRSESRERSRERRVNENYMNDRLRRRTRSPMNKRYSRNRSNSINRNSQRRKYNSSLRNNIDRIKRYEEIYSDRYTPEDIIDMGKEIAKDIAKKELEKRMDEFTASEPLPTTLSSYDNCSCKCPNK